MNDILAPRNVQLEVTKTVLDDALERHGFDFGVFISVKVSPDGRCHLECAVTGDGPQSLEGTIPHALRRIADQVETSMRKQGREWLGSMS